MNNNLCECNCGKLTRPGKRFIRGHNRRGITTKVILKGNPCECGCLGVANYGKRYISGHNSTLNNPMKDRNHTIESRQKISKNHGRGMLGKSHTLEARQKMSQNNAMTGARSQEIREKISKAHIGMKHTLETKKKLSLINKGKISPTKGVPHTDEAKEKMSKAHKENWANGVYNTARPRFSKQEKRLSSVMNALGFEWSGENPFYINGGTQRRVPDYYNKTTHEVIEVFGYWYHRDKWLPEGKKHQTPEEYIQWYAEAGWDCTVYWTDEFEEYCKDKEGYIKP